MSWDGCSQRREFWGGGPVSKDAAYGAVRGSIGTGSLYDEGTDSEKFALSRRLCLESRGRPRSGLMD